MENKMSQKNIKIIQNILKKEGKHHIAIQLENAYYEERIFDIENSALGEINIFVHPNNFIKLENLIDIDIKFLIQLFNGLPNNHKCITSIIFSIKTDIELEKSSDTVYIFVDEAGDMDFSTKGSKYYMFNFLIKQRPFNLHEYIANYRYSLLEKNLYPLQGRRLNIESFHACEDNKYIKEEMFNIISTFDKKSVKAYSYILEKPKVLPTKRKEKDKFYINNLTLAIQQLLDKLSINKNFIIITDRLPVQKNKSKQVGALKKGIKEYLKNHNLMVRYDIFHHCSASSVNLQIVDYISWAIYKKFEFGDDSYYEKIEKYLMQIDNMTEKRDIAHYEK
jgi:hypothetical protein